jgi:hypothetical protein
LCFFCFFCFNKQQALLYFFSFFSLKKGLCIREKFWIEFAKTNTWMQ